jgi:hypothetical protein
MMIQPESDDMTRMLHDSFFDGRQLVDTLLAEEADPDAAHGCGDPFCHDCGVAI